MKFIELGLSDSLVSAVEKNGYTESTPIQAQAIPKILAGKNLLAAAETGTGKTAAFALPIIQKLNNKNQGKYKRIKALVLTPTRELASQVGSNFKKYASHSNLRIVDVYGGVKISQQIKQLSNGTDILVATPGRLIDLMNQNQLDISNIDIFVLDEADRMLDMGFMPDIKRIIKQLPLEKQTVMFSATFSKEIKKLANSLMTNAEEISISKSNSSGKNIKQFVYPVDKSRKQELLTHLIKEKSWYQVLVFSRTKYGANRIVTRLGKSKISAAAIHGDKSQSQRSKALLDFKKGRLNVLVATDIASRGIDINKLQQVVNFDLPNAPEDYVHRIGRTGRAGESGLAISLVSADEIKQLGGIEKLTRKKIEQVFIDGFEPEHNLPEIKIDKKPKFKKKTFFKKKKKSLFEKRNSKAKH
jgi:ATP-dependent RNA helicase RhlE